MLSDTKVNFRNQLPTFSTKTGNDMKNYYRTVYHKTQVSTKFTRKFFIKTTPNKQSHVKNALKIKIDQIVIEFH